MSGRVVNAATGLAIPRVLIRLDSRALLTDHEGKFAFEQITASAVNLEISKPGFFTSPDISDSPSMYFRLDQVTGPVELRLFPEALLTGTVLAPDGEPLARIGVVARRNTFDDQGRHLVIAGQAQTDLHGNFRLPVSAGDYRIETRYIPRNAGDRDAILPVAVPAGGTGPQVLHVTSGEEQHFDVRPQVRRTFPVLLGIEAGSDRGFPMVTAHTSDGMSFNVGVVPTRVPGHANLYLPTGTYRLSARIQKAEAVEIAETNVTVTGTEQLTPDASITPASGIMLRFVDTAAIPVELSVDSDSASDNNSQPSRSSSTGSRQILRQSGGPNIGQFGLMLRRLNESDDEQLGNVGLVTPRDAPPGFSAPPGSYRLTSRGFGIWYIKSATYGSSDLLGHDITIAAGAGGGTIRLIASNQTGDVQGVVRLNDQPLSSCWIYLINNGPALTPVYSLRSGVDGTFNNQFLPPGSYRIIAFERRLSSDLTEPASLAKYSSWVQSVTVSAGGQATVNLTAVPQTEMKP